MHNTMAVKFSLEGPSKDPCCGLTGVLEVLGRPFFSTTPLLTPITPQLTIQSPLSQPSVGHTKSCAKRGYGRWLLEVPAPRYFPPAQSELLPVSETRPPSLAPTRPARPLVAESAAPFLAVR